ncbi:uncharacterized protein [Triticum aestivum]|uniref:uncharacterized protein isoform X2 n=1 Tax=Triticum aestivum TaxID=4565 RepID=UPI001D014559|nr:uncharacterized protein LOC123064982 isoform X2 [Triticum aestivum]
MERSPRRRCGRAPRPPAMDQTPTPSTASSIRSGLSIRAPNPRSPAATRGRIRQSLLYSDRPRRFRRPTSDKLPVEEHADEVSSREFEALTLDQSRPTPKSTHRVEKNASKVSSSEGSTVTDLLELTDRVEKNAGKASDIQGPAVKAPPVKEDASEVCSREFKSVTLGQSLPTFNNPTQRSRKRDYYAADSTTRSEIFEEMLKDVSEPWAQKCRDMRKYLEEHTYTCMVEAMIAAEHGFSNPAQHKLDAQAFLASEGAFEAPEVPQSFASRRENIAQAEVSTEEILENGEKWMGEEVMLAFKKYKEGKSQFKDVVHYGLDELQHQCFSMESCDHTFHHFNFTVKMEKSGGDSSSTPFFAEVKEIHGRKYYSCYELSSHDDGHCHACKNQGMHALKHPICLMGYDSGHADMESPFLYLRDDE